MGFLEKVSHAQSNRVKFYNLRVKLINKKAYQKKNHFLICDCRHVWPTQKRPLNERIRSVAQQTFNFSNCHSTNIDDNSINLKDTDDVNIKNSIHNNDNNIEQGKITSISSKDATPSLSHNIMQLFLIVIGDQNGLQPLHTQHNKLCSTNNNSDKNSNEAMSSVVWIDDIDTIKDRMLTTIRKSSNAKENNDIPILFLPDSPVFQCSQEYYFFLNHSAM